MKIKKILVSQPEPTSEKSPYYDLAKKNNIKVDFRPFIEVEGISGKEFRKERINILEHSAVIFTSKTSVDHFFRVCKELKMAVPDAMKYFCVTESIAFYLQKYIIYRKRKIFFSNNNKFDDLLPLIMKHKDEKFLLPLSDKHKPEIPRKLKQKHVGYSKAILYRTICCDLSDIVENDYDVFVFFSPSGIKSLMQNFPEFEQRNIKIASFGTSTAKAVKDAGLRLDIQAPKPQTPSMTLALEEYIKKYNKVGK